MKYSFPDDKIAVYGQPRCPACRHSSGVGGAVCDEEIASQTQALIDKILIAQHYYFFVANEDEYASKE